MNAPSPSTESLSLSPAAQWTLHHALLERIDAEPTAADPTGIDPPPLAVYTAFERLDAGARTFSDAELDAMCDVVRDAHHAPDWCAERDRLESLLHALTRALERSRPTIGHGIADD